MAEIVPREVVPIPFLFALGQAVHWAGGGQVWEFVWQVLQRRYTQSMVNHWNEYLLIAATNTGHAPTWVYEADLVPARAWQP